MDNSINKRFYQIREVAEILQIPVSTLRYWESQFTIIKPRRSASNRRYYTPEDIEIIRMVYFLVKQKGLKLDAAQEQIRVNRDNVSQRAEILNRLKMVRDELNGMRAALDSIEVED